MYLFRNYGPLPLVHSLAFSAAGSGSSRQKDILLRKGSFITFHTSLVSKLLKPVQHLQSLLALMRMFIGLTIWDRVEEYHGFPDLISPFLASGDLIGHSLKIVSSAYGQFDGSLLRLSRKYALVLKSRFRAYVEALAVFNCIALGLQATCTGCLQGGRKASDTS